MGNSHPGRTAASRSFSQFLPIKVRVLGGAWEGPRDLASAACALVRRQGTTAPRREPRDGSCQLQGGLRFYLSLLPEATFLGFHSHRGRVLIHNHHSRPQMGLYTGR